MEVPFAYDLFSYWGLVLLGSVPATASQFISVF